MPRDLREEEDVAQAILFDLIPEEDGLMEPTSTSSQRAPVVIVDCQNSVENPINLVDRRNMTLQRFDLTKDGRRYISTSNGCPLPTALSDRILTGLISYQFAVDPSFSSRTLQVEARRLIEDFMFPGRFTEYSAYGDLCKRVLEQLRRIYHTTLSTDCWYDRSKGERIEIHAKYINHLEIIYNGDNNTPKTIEIEWGKRAFESLRSRHTRTLNTEVYSAVKEGLEMRLYRYLDRQLSGKVEQKHRSIQVFARSKLSMRGKVVERGGRTASTYIASKIRNAIEGLNGKGFPVRVEIDDSSKDFSITFKRLPGGRSNEVVAVDEPGELICHFRNVVHGATGQRWRFAADDRQLAQAWIDQYGLEASRWMTEKAAYWFENDQPPQKDRRSRKPRRFVALASYEDAARGAWEMWLREKAGQKRLPLEASSEATSLPSYDHYVASITQRQEEHTDQLLVEAVRSDLENEAGWASAGEHMREKWLTGATLEARIKAYNLMTRAEYEVWTDPADLDQELINRHRLTLAQLASNKA